MASPTPSLPGLPGVPRSAVVIVVVASLALVVLDFFKPGWKVADIAAIAGLAIALIGFAVTIILAKQAKTAAELAKGEVTKVRKDLETFDVVRSASEAVAIFEEIERRFLIEGGWINLHERYNALYRTLGTLRAAPLLVPLAQKKKLASAQAEVSDIRNQLRSAAMQKVEPKNLEGMSKQTSLHADNIADFLEALKNQIGLDNGY